jgi:hypothetical protein
MAEDTMAEDTMAEDTMAEDTDMKEAGVDTGNIANTAETMMMTGVVLFL